MITALEIIGSYKRDKRRDFIVYRRIHIIYCAIGGTKTLLNNPIFYDFLFNVVIKTSNFVIRLIISG